MERPAVPGGDEDQTRPLALEANASGQFQTTVRIRPHVRFDAAMARAAEIN